MILVDANVLIYAHVRDFAQHERARFWLDQTLSDVPRVGLPWSSLVAFVRIVTNPRIFAAPSTTVAAWSQVCDWLEAGPVWIPEHTPRHREILGGLLISSGARANLVHDAHLAALAIEHGLALATTDGDFARFQDLQRIDPLRDTSPPRRGRR